jgi:hypothetical protein
MAGFQEFGDDGGTDVPGRAGDKDVHGISPSVDAIKSMTTSRIASKTSFI